jgi:HPt (histidine-containing phosphotransfer) domain-containing protein
VATSAHKIKGMAGNISAEDVRRIASELEALGKQDQLANAQASLEQLQTEVGRFRQYLASALADLAGPAVASDPQIQTNPERRNG